MATKLDQIRFEMEQPRRELETGRQHAQQFEREAERRFWIQLVVTSIAGVTVAAALIVHLLG